MSEPFQWAVIAFVILSILYHVWKGARANPQNTGEIGAQVNGLSNKVTGLSGRVGHLESVFAKLEQEAATTEDVEQLKALLNEKFNTIDAKMTGQQELSRATNRNVQRIYDIMLDKGLGGK